MNKENTNIPSGPIVENSSIYWQERLYEDNANWIIALYPFIFMIGININPNFLKYPLFYTIPWVISSGLMALLNIDPTDNFKQRYQASFEFKCRDYLQPLQIIPLNTSSEEFGPDCPIDSIFIRFPTLEFDNTLEENGNVVQISKEIYEAYLEEIRTYLRGRSYIQNIYLEGVQTDTSPPYAAFLTISSKEIFDPLKISVPSTVAVRNRTEFLKNHSNPQILLALEIIGDKMLFEIFNVISNESDNEKRKIAIELFQSHLTKILNIQIISTFNYSTRTRLPHDPHNPASRYFGTSRINPSASLHNTDEGFFYVEKTYENGEVRRIPLLELIYPSRGRLPNNHGNPAHHHPGPNPRPNLQNTDQDNEVRSQVVSDPAKPLNASLADILASSSVYKKAQLLIALFSLSKKEDFGKVNELMDPKMLESEIAKCGITLKYSPISKDFVIDKSIVCKSEVLLRMGQAWSALVGLVCVIISFTFISEFLTGDKISNSPLEQVSDFASPISSEIPPIYPIWKVSSNEIDIQNKYWITSIYEKFRAGNWEHDRVVDPFDNFELPNIFDESSPHVKISRKFYNSGDTFFIPILENTEVQAIKAYTDIGDEVPLQILKSKSGVIEVTIDPEKTIENIKANITIYLAPSKIPPIVPIVPRQVDIIFPQGQMSPATKDLLIEANEIESKGIIPPDEAMAQAIRESYFYGIDTEGNADLANSQSPAEFVAKATQLESMHCNTANTLEALLSEPDRVYASGYFGVQLDPSQDDLGEGYIVTSSAHAYTIDSEGEIIDATPNEHDPSLQVIAGKDNWEENLASWKNANKTPLKSKYLRYRKEVIKEINLNYVYSLLAFGALGYLLKKRKSGRTLTRYSQNIENTLPNNSLSQETVQFLLRLSWGKFSNYFHFNENSPLYTFDNLLQNTRSTILENYLKSPTKFEPKNWSKLQKRNSRLLAKTIFKIKKTQN